MANVLANTPQVSLRLRDALAGRRACGSEDFARQVGFLPRWLGVPPQDLTAGRTRENVHAAFMCTSAFGWVGGSSFGYVL